MSEETPFQAVQRLQQAVDVIDGQIVEKRQRIPRERRNAEMSKILQRDLEKLLEKRDAIIRNILQIKKQYHQQKQTV